jgi:NAD(P)-dependent dehydrogenase (short-subunit alcohol dehydrogenase family)
MAGAAVTLADANEESVRAAAAELASAGHTSLAVRCDVTDDAEVAAMVERTIAEFGQIDAAFNNAGVQSPAAELPNVTRDEFERVIGINLRGVWNCMRHELRHMRKQASGAIVNCSSFGGLVGIAGRRTTLRSTG